MSEEKELIDRVMQFVRSKGKKRETVMYGYHPALQKEFENAGITISKVFTGNLELLAQKELGCIEEKELGGKSGSYCVIIPFFLPDGGAAQREKMQQFGYKERSDYIFYPQNETSPIARLGEMLEMRKKVESLNKRIDELEKEKRSLLPNESLIRWYSEPRAGESAMSAKKRFFGELPPAVGTLRKMQLAGVILLAKLHSVCSANGIPYWASFGTLLGAVRHGGFIPWDDDTDVCMMRADAMRLTEIMRDDEDFYVSHIFAEFDDNLNHCVQLKFRRGAPYCLDIFIYDYCAELSDTTVKRQAELNALLAKEAQPIRALNLPLEERDKRYSELLEKYLETSKREVGTTNDPDGYMIWALDNFRCHEAFQSNCGIDEVFPLKTAMFEGLPLKTPWSADEYLEKKYGNIYSLPNDILTHV
ncbi:MAG: LicD family protein, partial [Ruminococcus sp.]|nr:LicD family protein [Ruminococcus sp.]